MPFEVRRLGHTIAHWAAQIAAWHQPHVAIGPSDSINNLAKRFKRIASSLVNIRCHRVRFQLYAGKFGSLLTTIQP